MTTEINANVFFLGRDKGRAPSAVQPKKKREANAGCAPRERLHSYFMSLSLRRSSARVKNREKNFIR